MRIIGPVFHCVQKWLDIKVTVCRHTILAPTSCLEVLGSLYKGLIPLPCSDGRRAEVGWFPTDESFFSGLDGLRLVDEDAEVRQLLSK